MTTTPSTDHVYVDTETVRKLPATPDAVWEGAFAVNDGPVIASFLPHTLDHADPESMAMNGHADRYREATKLGAAYFEARMIAALTGQTMVCANPHFDASMLSARWGVEPWHYRLLDVSAYAAGVLGLPTNPPPGLKDVTAALRARGHSIPEPDHTAGRDVETLRACHLALVAEVARRG